MQRKTINLDSWQTIVSNFAKTPEQRLIIFRQLAHDELVEIIRNYSNWLNTPSWREGGAYSARIPGRPLIESIQDYKLMREA